MAFRKLLVLAAVMLLAAPVVKSVPTDYVVSEEQSADVVPAAGEPKSCEALLSVQSLIASLRHCCCASSSLSKLRKHIEITGLEYSSVPTLI
jgi:hypothetical protein